jgi:hypothetical protein
MSLPKAYMTSTKRLPNILEAMQSAQAPKSFSQRFLVQLGFTSKGDRLVIGVLKDLDFTDDKNVPKERYYKFLDQSRSGLVLAESIRDAWSDLFAVNVNAHQLTKAEFKGKLKTLSQGQLTDNVLEFHYATFNALVKVADFTVDAAGAGAAIKEPVKEEKKKVAKVKGLVQEEPKIGGLVYNIQIVLPDSRDPAVYDALFRSLKEHLL